MQKIGIVTSMDRDEIAAKQIEILSLDLRERIKELTGICSLGKLTDETNDLDEIFNRFVREIVPPSIQFPELTFVKIEFDGKKYTNVDSEPGYIKKDGLYAPITVMGKERGSLLVSYTRDSSFIEKFEQNLINSYAEWLGKIIERVEALKQVTTTRDQMLNILNSASELIVSANREGSIIQWNNSIANYTGVLKRDMLRKNIYDDNLPESVKPIAEVMANMLKKFKSGVCQVKSKDKNNIEQNIICSVSLIRGVGDEFEGVMMIGRVYSQNQIINQISPGNSYLSYDKQFSELCKIFEGFRVKGYYPLFISRNVSDLLQAHLNKENNTVLLASHDKTLNHADNPESLLKDIMEFLSKTKKAFIILDRIDYLVSLHGFDAILKLFYSCNDLIRMHGSILVMNVTTASFSEQQKSRLSDEFKALPEVKEEKPYLDSQKMEILRFISSKNSFYQGVYFEIVRSNFSVSKKLTKKWISELEHAGLVRTEQKGRRKNIYVTDKGLRAI